MKRMLFALCLTLSLAVAMPVWATDTLDLYSIGSGPYGTITYGGDYVGPIGAGLNGGSAIPGGATCLDITTETYVPTSYAVTVDTLVPVNLTNVKFWQGNPNQLFYYEEAAVLIGEMASNPSQIGEIQYAIWRIMDPSAPSSGMGPADIAIENYWIAWAAGINPAQWNFSSVDIYTPTPNPASNQEFMTGAATSAVPIPAAVWLLGSGLLGLVGVRRRSKS